LRKANTDTVMWYLSATGTPNQMKQFWIAALDDDGLVRGRTSGTPWVVFADSAPKKPDVTFDKPGGGNVTLKWKNLDAKDDSLTQFSIVLGTSETACNDTLVSWTAANNAIFQKSSGWMTYTFNPGDTGRTPHYSTDFYFMVISRDARGTKSRSNNGTGILISYP